MAKSDKKAAPEEPAKSNDNFDLMYEVMKKLLIDSDEKKKPKHKGTPKIRRGRRYGVTTGDGKKGAYIRFLSDKKELTLTMGDAELLKFAQHEFTTDDQEEIDFIRSHPAFGQNIWEGEYPKEVMEKFKQENDLLTYSSDMFEVPE